MILDAPTVSLEEIQRTTLFVLINSLNDALDDVEIAKAASDEALAAVQGIPYVATTLEAVALSNFVEGHRPSLISAPLDNYPNVAVMANMATPGTGTELFDHQEIFSLALQIEIMVKSETSEEEVNRRAQRTAEAVQLVMARNPTLSGAVSGLGTPTVEISDVFTRKQKTSYGPHWFWQGARLRYAVRKEARHPSTTGSFLRTADIDIDQP